MHFPGKNGLLWHCHCYHNFLYCCVCSKVNSQPVLKDARRALMESFSFLNIFNGTNLLGAEVSTIWDENLYTGPIKTLHRPQKLYIFFFNSKWQTLYTNIFKKNKKMLYTKYLYKFTFLKLYFASFYLGVVLYATHAPFACVSSS